MYNDIYLLLIRTKMYILYIHISKSSERYYLKKKRKKHVDKF